MTRAGTHTPVLVGLFDLDQAGQLRRHHKVGPERLRQGRAEANIDSEDPAGQLVRGEILSRLYQVHGNVLEWTEDCFHAGYTGAPTDGSAWVNGGDCDADAHIVRGGSWDEAWAFALAEFRGKGGDRSNIVGLRVARTLQSSNRNNPVLARQAQEPDNGTR